jgi:hypothetical protein
MSADIFATATCVTGFEIGRIHARLTLEAPQNREGTIVRYALLVLAVALAGCSAMQAREAADSEEILAQAGFQREPLDGPGLPARQLVQSGSTYRFADPDYCQCVYVGGEKEYAELQRLRAARIADHEWALRHGSFGNTYSPTTWGAWKPEGLDVVKSPIVTTDTQKRPAVH